MMSRFFIALIKVYQKVAPKAIRGKCRFEPCCSDYMILAIQKYGVRKGIKKGINRVMRCKPPNGGIDIP